MEASRIDERSNDHGPPVPAAGSVRLERPKVTAPRCGISVSYMWALIAAKKFPAPIKIGRASLFVSSEVDEWLQQRIRESRAS